MPLESGASIGAYTVIAKLGEGGMGEVYRARDSKLKREVAIKVLPADVAGDRERLARFQREAEVLASLNHPHIAHVYGIEDGALVMELVEGEDLSQRVARGPVPLDEALPIARQIAEALEAAHEQGIIHRDLKPANIKVRDDGTVKVLDFGLAKAFQDPKTPGPQDPSHSPTITSPAMTQRGVILGTAAYMSPEQAKGKPVDKRADIWAFGCVLYEMLAGKRAFKGEDVTDTITAVMRDVPDWHALPVQTPPAIRTLLRRCLEKDARRRPPHIGIARMEIEDAMTSTAEMMAITPPPEPKPARKPWWRWFGFFALTILALAAGWRYGQSSVPDRPRPQPLRFTVEAPHTISPPVLASSLSLSPDGTRLAYVAQPRGRRPALWLHTFADGTARELENTSGAAAPFWSDSGNGIAFSAADQLKVFDLLSGSVQTLCDCRAPSSGTWNRDGIILVSSQAIERVPATGGKPEPVTVVDTVRGDLRHYRPRFLPDGRHFVFAAINREQDKSTLQLGELGSTVTRVLAEVPSSAAYVEPGFLLYAHNNRLIARPFDMKTLDWSGDPIVISESVRQNLWGAAAFAASPSGVIAYDTTNQSDQELELSWVGRDGSAVSTFATLAGGHTMALSPDERFAAIEQPGSGTTSAVWLLDGERGTRTRLTFERGTQGHPVWSPESRRVAYAAGQPGAISRLLVKSANGTREAETVWSGADKSLTYPQPTDWSRDGLVIVYEENNPDSSWDLKYLKLDGDRRAEVAVQTQFQERLGQLSPDGRLIAYESYETGQPEVFVATFPEAAMRWPISNRGGAKPRWSNNGRELLFVDLDGQLQSVGIDLSGGFKAGRPTPLFELGGIDTDGHNYAVSRDGKRILVMRTSARAAPPKLSVIMNWRPD